MTKILTSAFGILLTTTMPANAAAVPAKTVAQPTARPKTTAVDPAALALAQQILAIGIPVEKRSQMFSSMMDSLTEQARKATENMGSAKDKDFQAIVDRSTRRMWDGMRPVMDAAIPDIFESMARAYAREFSVDDLKALLAFVKTPAGQRFFERAPQILKDPDVQASQQRMMAQMMSKVPEILREDRQDIDDYVAKKAKEEKAEAPTPVS